TATARNWLWAAFRERAERELAGERGGAAPGAALLRALDQVNPATRTAIDRLRQHSRILEPYERTDPYRFQRDYRGDGTGRQLAELAALTDPAAFRARAGRLFKEYRTARAKFRLLGTAIGRGFRC